MQKAASAWARWSKVIIKQRFATSSGIHAASFPANRMQRQRWFNQWVVFQGKSGHFCYCPTLANRTRSINISLGFPPQYHLNPCTPSQLRIGEVSLNTRGRKSLHHCHVGVLCICQTWVWSAFGWNIASILRVCSTPALSITGKMQMVRRFSPSHFMLLSDWEDFRRCLLVASRSEYRPQIGWSSVARYQ